MTTLSDRAKAVAALEEERARLWQEAKELTAIQARTIKQVSDEIQILSNRQKIIIAHMIEIDDAQAALLYSVALDRRCCP